MSSAAIKQLTERNAQLESQRKNSLARARQEGEKFTGLAIAAASATVAGYVDGRFDLTKKDTVEGDGVRIFGAPVVPVVGLAVGVAGVWMGGKTGTALIFSALGIGCGSLYDKGRQKGIKDYQKQLAAAAAEAVATAA
jgi:hypothetical protein